MIFHRYSQNPILKPRDWPYRLNAVFNPGAVKIDGETILVIRAEDMQGFSHFALARSKDGVTNWEIEKKPFMVPEPKKYPEEEWGIEDPRIVFVEEMQAYIITYVAYSYQGAVISLAKTTDFTSVEKIGRILPPEDKNACLFPEKIDGRWAILHRPVPASGLGAHIWISFSPDLKHWGDHSIVLKARAGAWWDSYKIGLNPPPIKTDHGWLLIYHGSKNTSSGRIYRLGLALLDLKNPLKVLRRSREWILSPEQTYERVGDVDNVVFPCGLVWDKKTDDARLYYGAADTTVCLATAKMKDVLDYLLSCPQE